MAIAAKTVTARLSGTTAQTFTVLPRCIAIEFLPDTTTVDVSVLFEGNPDAVNLADGTAWNSPRLPEGQYLKTGTFTLTPAATVNVAVVQWVEV